MNDKDKAFFAKIILVSVIFIAFLTVLGLTVELVKNRKAVNREPQVLVNENNNLTEEYLKNCDWQYEESQKENISKALNDILSLTEEELRNERYSDYAGKQNQWSLSKLIYSHCVWEAGKLLGDNFKKKEVQDAVKEILEKNFAKDETADWKTYKPIINPKYPSKDLLKFEFKYPSEWYYNESGIAKCQEEPDRMNPYCRYDALYIVFGNNKESLNQKYFSFLSTTAVIIAGGKGSTGILCSGHNNIELVEIKKISGKEWYIYKYQDLEDVLFYNRSALGSGVTNYCNEFIDFMAISSNKETKIRVEKILETLKFY